MDKNKSVSGGKRKNVIGNKYGRLTVLSDAKDRSLPGGQTVRFVLCRCDCGNEKEINLGRLKHGRVKSCGCIRGEDLTIYGKGFHNGHFYRKWTDIKTRCNNKNNVRFSDWGGRGIKVCKNWNKISGFYNDMYKSYLQHVKKYGEKNTTIERINNNDSYYKGNCKWATYKEQANNRRSNRIITFNNIALNLCQWSRKLGIKRRTITNRIDRDNWSIEDALTTPVGQKRRK